MHAITGESVEETRTRAWQQVGYASTPEELGTALHYFGDSYAHINMWHPERMYVPGAGHLAFGHGPDKIYNRPGLYKQYVRDLSTVLESGNIDFFTFDYVADSKKSSEENMSIFETEVRIREGVNIFDVDGDFGDAIKKYVKQSNNHFHRNLNVETVKGTKMKKNDDGSYSPDGERTVVVIKQ
jgi:hypothetical protein